MFIQTEATPNPETIKFIPGRPVLGTGTLFFEKAEDAGSSPLARTLFALDGVAAVFLGQDFIAVTKHPQADWGLMKTPVLAALMDHFVMGLPVLEEGAIPQAHASLGAPDLSDSLTAQIIELLDTRVRPAVAQDGGDIQFDRFDKGILYLRLQGACSGCPSSTITLKDGIERMLRHYVPEILEVRAVG